MKKILICLPGNEILLNNIGKILNIPIGKVEIHTFPDEETCIRLLFDCQNTEIIIIASLDRPNEKIVPLILLAQTCHDLGAKKIGLVTPYLAYMRQDKRFQEGQGVSAKYFAKLISPYFNWLLCVSPHLHRIKNLNEIYTITTYVLQATHEIANWIKHNIHHPVLIGPDSESEQWVSSIAKLANSPYIILEKTRHADKEVSIQMPDIKKLHSATPVIVDDIISSGHTLLTLAKQLLQGHFPAPICIGVHGLFAENAYAQLQSLGCNVITTNSIQHSSNKIDLSELIATQLKSIQVD
jgi:ribose-phosphate pyrophosphokinase